MQVQLLVRAVQPPLWLRALQSLSVHQALALAAATTSTRPAAVPPSSRACV